MSIWLAQLIGPVVVVTALNMVIAPGRVHALATSFMASPALVFISGVLAMLAGLAIVNSHNLWLWGWPVAITLLGWALVVGGAIRVLMPQWVQDVGGAMINAGSWTRTAGTAWLGSRSQH